MCEIHFAIEQNLDMIAHEIGMSEVDIRRVNGLRAGGATATGQILEDCGYQDCLETVVKELEYDKPCEQVAPNLIRAKGIAGGWKSPSQPTDVASAAIIRMNEDGTFMLMTSGQDIGQGSDTVLTQIAAEVLAEAVQASLAGYEAAWKITPLTSGRRSRAAPPTARATRSNWPPRTRRTRSSSWRRSSSDAASATSSSRTAMWCIRSTRTKRSR